MATSPTATTEGVQVAGNHPVFHIEPMGRLANQMIQYMVALNFASLVPGCRISNVDLPGWDIVLPPIEDSGSSLTWSEMHHFETESLANRMKAGAFQQLRYQGYGQRMENFLPRAVYQRIFQAPQHADAGFGPEYLLCHVRAGDVLTAAHPSYVLTPVAFYQEIVARTGLVPVFMGETSPGKYMDRLIAALPQARVLPQGDIIRDFETIRQSKNILVSCSSFCWLAAWLSEADRIFMPVNGVLNPRQHHRVNLLPLDDPRYRFYLFPINYAVPEADHIRRHKAMAGMWQEISHAELRSVISEAPRTPRRMESFVKIFDEAFYRARYPELRSCLESGRFASGLDHFRQLGFAAGWQGFRFDEHWYTTQYPAAAMEISRGEYFDAMHHFAAIGRSRGFRPTPPLYDRIRQWYRNRSMH
jgi:hypothetical protein